MVKKTYLPMINILSNIASHHSRKNWTIQLHTLYLLTKICKTSHVDATTKNSGRGRFTDSTLKFKGLELNIKVFFTFLSDIHDSIMLSLFFPAP